MGMKVYELARSMDVPSRKVIETASQVGIRASSASSKLTDQDEATLKKLLHASPAETEGHVVRFDPGTGKGQVAVTTTGKQTPLTFDLKRTRLENKKYVSIQPGMRVRMKVVGPTVDAISVEPN